MAAPLHYMSTDEQLEKEFMEFLQIFKQPGVFRPDRKKRLKELFIQLIKRASNCYRLSKYSAKSQLANKPLYEVQEMPEGRVVTATVGLQSIRFFIAR